MINWARALLGTLKEIATALGACVAVLEAGLTVRSETSDFEQRLAALEREITKREAEAEATLVQAESRFKAARAAEERARHHARTAEVAGEGEEDLSPEEIAAAYEEAGLPLGDAEVGPEEGLHPLPSRMERRRASKSNALELKFGRG